MAMSEGKLSFVNIPKNFAYEDYIAALLMVRGEFFLDRAVKKKTSGLGDELELDIVLSQYASKDSPVNKILVEIKSGKDWGLDDVFKMRGWMDYMDYKNSAFIVQQINEKSFPLLQSIAEKMDITLIDNTEVDGKLNDTKIIDALNLHVPDVDKSIHQTIRFALHLERMMLDYLYRMKKSNNGNGTLCYKKLVEYWAGFNNAPFFENNPDRRIGKIFECWVENKNIAARVDHELNNEGWLDSEQSKIFVDGHYIKLYYEDVSISPVMIALHIELMNRLSILKACVDELTEPQSTPEGFFERLLQSIGKAALPSNISEGLKDLKREPYFYLYPRLWQLFIYGFGGFILLDKEKEEYELLSRLSGIPVDNILNALNIFDVLFPTSKGWLRIYKETNIKMLAMMPPPLLGIGANMRRLLYRGGDNEELASYEHLSKFVTGKCTLTNLIHWNNVAYEFLKKDSTLIHSEVKSSD